MFKVKNRNAGTTCEIFSKLTIKTPERRQWRRCGVFILNFEHKSHLVLAGLNTGCFSRPRPLLGARKWTPKN